MNKNIECNPGRERNHFIDVLKGICIIFVIITHFPWEDGERLKYLFPFWIEMAVPIFMIISGYVYAFSYRNKGILRIEEAYLKENIINKIMRYTLPFMIAFFIEELHFYNEGALSISLADIFALCLAFINGGAGPGSYYYPVMIQFVFVFPVIYFIIKKNGFKGVIICGGVNAIFELLKCAYMMNESCYRLLVFRYILVIAIGCYMADNDFAISKRAAVVSCMAGIIFIISESYLGYKPRIITYWTGTSFIACLYVIPLVMYMIKHLQDVRFEPLEILGRASYNIFLVQMLWYIFGFATVEALVSGRMIRLCINLAVCLVVGIIFYLIETPLTRWINKQIYNVILR